MLCAAGQPALEGLGPDWPDTDRSNDQASSSVNSLGCLRHRYYGRLHISRETLTGPVMAILVEDCLVLSTRALLPGPRPSCALMHDDPKFRSHVCQDGLRALGNHLVPQPPQSPDLNPMEYVWSALKSVLEKSRHMTLKELRRSITREWDGWIRAAILVESMPHRPSAVLRAKGGPTKYKMGGPNAWCMSSMAPNERVVYGRKNGVVPLLF